MVRVLIVDDSAFMRNILSNMLSSDPEISIVGTAKDGLDAVQKAAELRPDIVTMDVEMPKMDGIEALRLIMSKTPVPVIMVSSLTSEGARVTLEALEIGAVDYIPKNLSDLSLNIINIREALINKIKLIGRKGLSRKVRRDNRPVEIRRGPKFSAERKIGIVAIGTSTGGPMALMDIIPRLQGDFPVPVLIAQHMPPYFTGPFAERLNQYSRIRVKEAEDGEPLKPGVAFLAPGGGHMRIRKKGAIETVISISENKEEFIYRPSVDAMMTSVSEHYPGRALGVILTGMGNDGLQGLKDVKRTGGKIIAQNEDTCVIYGMPKAVVDAGIADKVLPIDDIAGEILNSV